MLWSVNPSVWALGPISRLSGFSEGLAHHLEDHTFCSAGPRLSSHPSFRTEAMLMFGFEGLGSAAVAVISRSVIRDKNKHCNHDQSLPSLQ